MANYVSANVAVPPNSVDQAWVGTTPIPEPNQNFTQHARLLPYMEQTVAYNAINWNSARGGVATMAAPATPIPPDGASGGYYSLFQYTVLTMQITSFLCPSDQNPGSSGTFPFRRARSWSAPATIRPTSA